jgi:hypothetical protein
MVIIASSLDLRLPFRNGTDNRPRRRRPPRETRSGPLDCPLIIAPYRSFGSGGVASFRIKWAKTVTTVDPR